MLPISEGLMVETEIFLRSYFSANLRTLLQIFVMDLERMHELFQNCTMIIIADRKLKFYESRNFIIPNGDFIKVEIL